MSTEQPSPSDLSLPSTRRRIPSWIQDILDRPASPPLHLWKPPEDPDKPSLPYMVSFTVEIRRRKAPTTAALRPELPRHYLETVTHSEAIMASPLESNTNSENDTNKDTETDAQSGQVRNETAQLLATAPIATGDARSAQLLAVTVTPNGSDTASSKPYEANFESGIGHHPEDCVYSASDDYINEATAYEYLHEAGKTGSFVPEYYGCWNLCLPITIKGASKLRSVNLVLIERLRGDSLLSTRIRSNPDGRETMDSFHYPEEFRLELLARAMDGYARLLRLGIVQRDFAARNLILVAQSPATPGHMVHDHHLPRIVLVDYNNAYILENTTQDQIQSLPVNPAAVFWAEHIWRQFRGWVPHEWEDTRLQKEWLLERFAGPGQRGLYLPTQDLEL
ncbi:hypothetical protein Daus18300_005431 [Diaporthe australafricana]|uniref:Protein kinase domain-containing protein n=1 Tax=Diaporthe australafricana TaxID=127596 RepID=A0ABR3X1L4_9PEZI